MVNQNTASIIDQPTIPIRHATLKELEIIIKRLKTRKAPGIDCVSNKAVKSLSKKNTVLNIFNACLRINYIPKCWKTAIIVTIPKLAKNHSIPEDHRPISLLSTFSKMLERLTLTRINKELENRNVIPQEQFEFREGQSCELQTLRLTELITKGLYWKKTTAISYLDISKAFGSV